MSSFGSKGRSEWRYVRVEDVEEGLWNASLLPYEVRVRVMAGARSVQRDGDVKEKNMSLRDKKYLERYYQ